MDYFLGIEGGGTRTTAWLADERKRIVARAIAGPSNPLKVGFSACQREILRAVREVLGRTRVPRGQLAAACVGLAGAASPPAHHRLVAWLRRTIPAERLLLTSDAAIALRAGIGDSPGMILISGTGSVAIARDERGRLVRSGGWGTLFDDAGSGYDLGRKAIMAALYDADGRGPHTQLLARVTRALKIKDIAEVALRPLSPEQIAALFPVVLECARRRDFVARALLRDAGRELANLALALVKRLSWVRRVILVVCSGGVFRSSRIVRKSFLLCLRHTAPYAKVMLLRHPPVEGALALARDLARAE